MSFSSAGTWLTLWFNMLAVVFFLIFQIPNVSWTTMTKRVYLKPSFPAKKKIFKIPRLVRNGSTMCWHQVSFFPSLFFFLSLSSIRGETLMGLLHKSKYKKEKDERYNYSRQKHSRLVSLLLNTITISTVGYNTIQNMCDHHLERCGNCIIVGRINGKL